MCRRGQSSMGEGGFFFFQAEDGIRGGHVTGVQTCALPISMVRGGKWVRDAGIRLLLDIRQEDPDAAVIVSSGAPYAKYVSESLKLGAHAFLMKPVLIEELLITVERALERRQLLIERRRRGAA